jgi:hypothetical protein
VSAGRYQVALTVGRRSLTQPFDVRPDPRLTHPAAEVAARDSMARAINAACREINDAPAPRAGCEGSGDALRRPREGLRLTPQRSPPRARRSARRPIPLARSFDKAANGQDIINYRNGINAQYVFLLGNRGEETTW